MTFNTSEKAISVFSHRGFSLVECLIATLLFIISCLGIFSLYQQQLRSTQALVNWHMADSVTSEKVRDLQAQTIGSLHGLGEVADNTGGALAAGQVEIDDATDITDMQRQWQVSTLRTGNLPLKQATITVAWSQGTTQGRVEQRVILWYPEKRRLPQLDAFNPVNE